MILSKWALKGAKKIQAQSTKDQVQKNYDLPKIRKQ